jgi:hypothetical protein
MLLSLRGDLRAAIIASGAFSSPFETAAASPPRGEENDGPHQPNLRPHPKFHSLIQIPQPHPEEREARLEG